MLLDVVSFTVDLLDEFPFFLHQEVLHRDFVSFLEIFDLVNTVLVYQPPCLREVFLLLFELIVSAALRRVSIYKVAFSFRKFLTESGFA
jgi:hypothetical protein